MVARHGCEALGESIAYYHLQSYGVDEFFNLWRDIGSGSGEDVGIGETQLLAHETQHGVVEHLVLQLKWQRHTLAL